MTDHQDSQFVCGACDKTYSGDISDVMTECRVCHRLHCNDCVDEYGRCVKCAEEESCKK
jgi:hypothetical protein